jgi:16S rRNA (uracil1498-N3)-methyltransferase
LCNHKRTPKQRHHETRIFIPGIQTLKSEDIFSLPKEYSHYIKNVLRLRPGAEITAVASLSYKDKIYLQQEEKIFVARCLLEKEDILLISKIEFSDPPQNIVATLAIATSKGDTIENSVVKATELGVDNIIVWQSERSIAKLQTDKLNRLKLLALSSSSQAGRLTIPNILYCDSIHTLAEYLIEACNPEQSFWGSLKPGTPLYSTLELAQKPVQLIIGPEGDFTDKEEDYLKEVGFTSYSLGSRRLRVETAVLSSIFAFETAFEINHHK